MRTRLVTSVSLAVAALAMLVALMPYTAVAAQREEISFTVGYFSREMSVVQMNDRVARASVDYFGVGGVDALGDEAGADLTWLVNSQTGRGTVSGTVTLFRSLTSVLWTGTISGHVTPEGAEGVLRLTAESTGQRFVGRWTSFNVVDPVSDPHEFGIEVTGAVTST